MSCNCSAPKRNNNPCKGCIGCGEKCHVVVTDVSEVNQFRNSFATVLNENATYHVDETGNVIAVSRNPIYSDSYSPTAGDYKMTTVYNFSVDEAYVFDAEGEYRVIYLYSNGGSSSS